MNKQQIAVLHEEGYIKQKEDGYFSVRIVTKAGTLTAQQMICLSEIADKYGRGQIGFTTRQSVEIPWIKEEYISEVKEKIKSAGLITGGTGKKVEPIAACKGTVCSYGLIDTLDLSNRLHERFFARELPGKFKIGIAGCPNNCVTAPIHDLGFMAQKLPRVEEDLCKGCTMCKRNCKANAIEMVEKRAKIDYEKCVQCGQCIKVCPFKAMQTEKEGLAVFIGGKFGRRYRIGDRLETLISIDEAVEITERVIAFYDKNGLPGERLADVVDRLGIDRVKAAVTVKSYL
ncbi:4Fe-4S binding protein [Fonticella tunisiensis]|uniref:Dissimilatory sulfite reductase (Desulfoviridin) alpha/beta subunit n=1 Tax=Fonticella tunisiensis TaxID=1096341 RepID=A0A4R7KCW2_9CLOT|nr:4Fe-4S binding protein [Fonticella tunisiensis]TDT51287.1 dissimilatory sulfite reductase (desulfoviridin) alpha/beta subunit [Fonticella tunisiensis]